MNAGIHLVHSCAETLLAHFSVLVDQDLSFSQTRSHVKVNKNTSCEQEIMLDLSVVCLKNAKSLRWYIWLLDLKQV